MRTPKGGIAFFDSGIGGLTVLAACRKRLRKEYFYYFGDNAHAPYGNLPPKKIRRYVFRAFRKIARLRPRAAVVACNTVTALCVEELRKKYPFPIVGAEPAVFLAGALGGETLVLSTRATYESPRFQALCKRTEEEFPRSRILPCACDGLAGEIERAVLKKGAEGLRELALSDHLPPRTPQTVVLGCTHYSFLRAEIAEFYGCQALDGNEGIAKRLQALLGEENSRVCFSDGEGGDHSRPQKTKKREKCDCKYCKKCRNRVKTEIKYERTFFFGGRKKQNKRIYKQMFGNFPREKWAEVVDVNNFLKKI